MSDIDHAEPRRERPDMPERVHATSIVIVNTGHGKGKSTAAFGTAVRALARDWDVGVVQFIKSGNWRTGEEQVLRQLGADWWALGDGFSWESTDLDESEAHALEAWKHSRQLLEAGRHDLLLFDEITYPMNWGWIDTNEVVEAIAKRAATTTVICTGRDAPPELVAIAETVTEMRQVKHAFEQGIRARRGIDY